MMFYEWLATDRDLSDAFVRALDGAELDPGEVQMVNALVNGIFREWENSHYQYERGLFGADEFLPRVERWRGGLSRPYFRDRWASQRLTFAPSFRAEIDRIVAEVEQAQ